MREERFTTESIEWDEPVNVATPNGTIHSTSGPYDPETSCGLPVKLLGLATATEEKTNCGACEAANEEGR